MNNRPVTPPKFEKRNHHYIPQFWLRGFADAKGTIWKRQGGKVSQTGAGSVMSEDWLYTVFDKDWLPSDALEDLLSRIEAKVAPAFRAIADPNTTPTADDWTLFLEFMGLTVCRHPDAMDRARALAHELAESMADVHLYKTDKEFLETFAAVLGAGFTDKDVQHLRTLSPEELKASAKAIVGLSPQDPALPKHESLKAHTLVASAMGMMNLDILFAPSGQSFVLADRPMPLKGMENGFSIPLSANAALKASPANGTATQWRGSASIAQVQAINAEQFSRAKTTIIAADRMLL